MGIFDKIKNTFRKNEKEEINDVSSNEIKIYNQGLTKSRENFVSKLVNLTNKYSKVTEEYLDELEEILIMADIGVNTVMEFMDRLRQRIKHENITSTSYLKEIIVDELFIIYVNGEVISSKINYASKKPTVILFVGVNGVGKTTTIAKLASKLNKEGKKTLLIAGDTFRAGAYEQLKLWADKIGSKFYGKENSDPASVVYDGIKKATQDNYDLVIVDTAGRLQNKSYLMDELRKMKKVIQKIIPDAPHEVFLVIDANTGQNGVVQAKVFKECTDLTGVIISKMDGTGKGGIILAIRDEIGVPVRFIGLGEKFDDLQEFDLDNYLYGLLIGEEE